MILEISNSIKCGETFVYVKKAIKFFNNNLLHAVIYIVHYFCGWSDSSSSALNMKDSEFHKNFNNLKNNTSHSVFASEIFRVQNSVH